MCEGRGEPTRLHLRNRREFVYCVENVYQNSTGQQRSHVEHGVLISRLAHYLKRSEICVFFAVTNANKYALKTLFFPVRFVAHLQP